MITKFNQYITESIKDKMTGKPLEDIFTYDNFKSILRSFIDDYNDNERSEHNDLNLLIEQMPILIDSNLKDLRYFVIKEDLFTGDNKSKTVHVKPYIDALDFYTKGSTPEIIKIPGLKSGLIETVLVNKNKKIIIIHAVHGTMVVIDKNIFEK